MIRDLKHAARTLSRTPLFSVLAILTIAIGIGANTAVFSGLNTLLIRPLPYFESERIVVIGEFEPRKWIRAGVSPRALKRWEDRADAFESFATLEEGVPLALPQNAGTVAASRVSGDFFDVLAVRAAVGRTFTADDAKAGAEPVAVISDDFWKRRWNADPRVLGSTIELANRKWTVVGVLAPGFRMMFSTTAVWIPEDPGRAASDRSAFAIARLRPGVPIEQAKRQLSDIHKSLAQDFAEEYAGWTTWVKPVRDYVVGERRPVVIILSATVLLVLVTACLNLGGLLMARATGRRMEISIRLALGCSKWRLVRQALSESLLIACAGGFAGLLLTIWIGRIGTASIPELKDFAVDANVLLFTCAITLLSAVALAVGPALLTRRYIDLRRGSRSRLRSAFAVAQTAIAVALLVTAGVLLRSLVRLHATQPGFRTEGIAVAELAVPADRFADAAARVALGAAVTDRMAGITGVQEAAAASSVPLFGVLPVNFEIEGRGRPEEVMAASRAVTHRYLGLFDIPLRRGRDFSAGDDERAPGVAIVNERMAELFWPGEDPVGRRIRMQGRDWATVVGVAANQHSLGLRRPPVPEILVPYAQSPTPQLSIAVRTAGDPAAVVAVIRRELASTFPDVAITYANTMPALMDEQLAAVRALLAFSGAFAALALILAGTGLYGVISYLTGQRTKEIGIRVALGATRQDVLNLVGFSGLRLAGAGVIFGNVAGLGLAWVLNSELLGARALDPLPFLGGTAVAGVAALAATMLPARRAALQDPAVCLRHE